MFIITGFVPPPMPAQPAIKLRVIPQILRSCKLPRQRSPSHLHSPIAVQRWFGTHRKIAIDSRPFAYTWLTRTPEKITPDDVLSSLPPTSSLADSGHIPILLVTPSFAQWIDTINPFLEQWMNRLYHKPTAPSSPSPIHAIVAVVDKIPDTRPQVVSEDTKESEGISLLFVKPENVQAKAAAPRRVRTMRSEESALMFSIQTGVPHISGEAVRRPIHEVGIRLANTLFINGNENTLFGTRWTYDPSSSKYIPSHSVNLSSCIVTSTAKAVHGSLELPLHPVGQRRKVISSLGNILRQVAKYADERSDEPIPASSELEKELPRYIAEHNIVDRRVSVWALVDKTKSGAQFEEASAHGHLIQSIQTGGKLHRVISGGGGWGKKQGLLSLDPENSFLEPDDTAEFFVIDRLFSPDDTSPIHSSPPSFDQPMMIDNLSSLSQVAGPGDYVQFFVSVDPGQVQSGRPGLPEPQEGSISCHFGVVSNAELLTPESTQQKDFIAIPNYFGALSEKAITYIQPNIKADSAEGLETGTKCDIPGSRVELILA